MTGPKGNTRTRCGRSRRVRPWMRRSRGILQPRRVPHPDRRQGNRVRSCRSFSGGPLSRPGGAGWTVFRVLCPASHVCGRLERLNVAEQNRTEGTVRSRQIERGGWLAGLRSRCATSAESSKMGFGSDQSMLVRWKGGDDASGNLAGVVQRVMALPGQRLERHNLELQPVPLARYCASRTIRFVSCDEGFPRGPMSAWKGCSSPGAQLTGTVGVMTMMALAGMGPSGHDA